MALTLAFKPGDVVFSHNPIGFGFNETSTFLFFRISVQTQSNLGGGYTTSSVHAEYPTMVDTVGICRFDIQEILRGLFDISFPDYDLDEDYLQQYFTFQVMAETIDADGEIVNTHTSPVYKCFWGGINFQKYRLNYFFGSFLPSVKKFFTWQPNNQKVDFALKTYATFVFTQEQTGAVVSLYIKMYFEDSTTQTVAIIPVDDSLLDFVPMVVPTGFDDLDLSDYEDPLLINKYDAWIGKPVINYSYNSIVEVWGNTFDVEITIDGVVEPVATNVTLNSLDDLVTLMNAFFTSEEIVAVATHSLATSMNIQSTGGAIFGHMVITDSVSNNYIPVATNTATIIELTEVRTYIVDRNYYRQKKHFIWQNSLGGFDAMLCTGIYINEFEYTGDEALIYVPYNYDFRDGERKPIEHEEQGIFTASTGWKTKAEIDHFRDALLTLMLAEDDGLQFIPIKIDRGTIRTLQTDQKLFALQFKYQHLFKNKVYTGEDLFDLSLPQIIDMGGGDVGDDNPE